jgi:PAS domain S-box-containing protein
VAADDLLHSLPCGFFAFTDDGVLVDSNRGLEEMLGYAPGELAQANISTILPPGGRIFYHTHLFPLLKMQSRVDEMYLALRTRGGEDVPVLLNGVRRERDGRFVSDCVCLRMIQRNEYEDQLLQARRLAEQSSEAKARFLSMMSHDLRAPLTTIYGNAQLLSAGQYGALSGEQLNAARIIADACLVQLGMMNDILDFARLDSGRVEVRSQRVPLSEVVWRSEALIGVQVAEAGLSLTIEGPVSELMAMADPNRLQQILLNLLTNAIKFTPEGGAIVVRCERQDARVLIHIRDTGIGIERDHLSRIFSPFVQIEPSATASSGRGVGLGLAISRELARAMGGDVTAQSTRGAGSTFTIELVAAEGEGE